MVQGIGNSPLDISRLLGILSKTGVRTDAQAGSGGSGAFSLPAGPDEAPGGLPLPTGTLLTGAQDDAGQALLQQMAGDVTVQMRVAGSTAGLSDLQGAAVSAEGQREAAQAARRAYTAQMAPQQEPLPGDAFAAATFRPQPRDRIARMAGDRPVRTRISGGLLLGLFGALLFIVLMIMLFSQDMYPALLKEPHDRP